MPSDTRSSPPSPAHPASRRFIGLMSGTSLDGVDGVLVEFSGDGPVVMAAAYREFPAALRDALLALQSSGADEIHREALAANALARCYADCVAQLLANSQAAPGSVCAIGAHGQTIRHQPGLHDGVGYTRQTQHPALLAELTGISVVADFRSRDIAAGGQGAPLVPAFHQALFGGAPDTRVACNLGGFSNISILPPAGSTAPVRGFDCGPGNVLLDLWVQRHRGTTYDAGGAWAQTGTVHAGLLAHLLEDPYFAQQPPKSTGRDLFNAAWLDERLQAFPTLLPADVQATLVALTGEAIARDIRSHAPDARSLILCGGGARNAAVVTYLREALPAVAVSTSAEHGVPPQQIEALAFAWLARQCIEGLPGNEPAVTGAHGPRILGALYPA
ncbi:anhydro-N-acetylmuramic acid kinase [Imbroritus primus]|uniref:anhydro-N-acetylmuramic acid kinase n=1 Tax=Imbroritus primus TaxID=3058603 RepID=UPI003D16037B